MTSNVRVGALAGTTGEFRMLLLTGLVDSNGVVAAGVRVDTPEGAQVADGSDDYFITASGESQNLAGRSRLQPPLEAMPQVVYLGSVSGERELLQALEDGRVDAVARGEIGNLDAAQAFGGRFVVSALDDEFELGGFTLAARDTDLAACLDDKINLLTDNQRIGYREWVEDPSIFMEQVDRANRGG